MTEPTKPNPLTLPSSALAEYQEWLTAIKQRVALAGNSTLIALYCELGAQIVDSEAQVQWGSGFIDAFSKDLGQTFPDIGGFSPKNLHY